MYYLGIDAGGTHTRAVLFDENSNEVFRSIHPSIHFMKVGFAGITKYLMEISNDLVNAEFDIESINVAIGCAGYGNDLAIRESIESAIFKVFPKAYITNDAHFAMISALNNQDGVYVISGTGSIAFRKYKDEYIRKGGFGYLLGDEGSAYWIGKKILSLYTKESDGRLIPTDLTTRINSSLNISTAHDLIKVSQNLGDDYRTWVASLTQLCHDCERVIKILVEAGIELAQLANAFVIEEPTHIVLAGGVLIHNEIVRNSMIENLDHNYVITLPKHPVEYASYLIFKNQV